MKKCGLVHERIHEKLYICIVNPNGANACIVQ